MLRVWSCGCRRGDTGALIVGRIILYLVREPSFTWAEGRREVVSFDSSFRNQSAYGYVSIVCAVTVAVPRHLCFRSVEIAFCLRVVVMHRCAPHRHHHRAFSSQSSSP